MFVIFKPVKFSKTSNKVIIPDGGMNTESMPLDVPSNMILAGMNHELADPKGIARIMGYERFDGHTKPSEAEYTVVLGTYAADAAKGNVLVGSVSGTIGTLLADYDNASVLVVYTDGAFIVGEDLTLGATTILSNITSTVEGAGAGDATVDFWLRVEAGTVARGDIGAVPGTGAMIGCAKFNGKVFAFRGTGIHYSSSIGWQMLALGQLVPFTVGTAISPNRPPAKGDTITNGTASADVVNVQKTVGNWGSSDAAGWITIKNKSGGNFSTGDSLTFTGGATATGGDEVQISRTGGGYLRTKVYNFTGDSDDIALWGTDEVNQAFKIDKDDNYIPIYTGFESYGVPEQIMPHHHHLFLSYGSNWVLSGIGDPFAPWTLVSGADQWGMGDDIVGAAVAPNGTMISFGENSVDVIYGESSANFAVKPYSAEFGAIKNSVQVTIAPTYVGEAGIQVLSQTSKWGDFELSDVDAFVKTLVDGIKSGITCSVVFRNKNEYRVYAGETCIRMKLAGGQIRGFTKDTYDIPINNISATMRDGVTADEVFFVSNTDYVYQMDSGYSFDGEEIPAAAMLAPEHLGQPRVKKRWHSTVLEAESIGGVSKFSAQKVYDLFQPGRLSLNSNEINTEFEIGRWDISRFDIAVFGDSLTDSYYTINQQGTSAAVSTMIHSNNTEEAPYVIKMINHRYSWRGEERQ